MRTSFHHQSEAQPPNGPLTAATSPDTPSHMPSHGVGLCGAVCCGNRDCRSRSAALAVSLQEDKARGLSHLKELHGKSLSRGFNRDNVALNAGDPFAKLAGLHF
jgi:hypothetical protein